ncbi:M2 family metallopeptidase [Fretibacter rubidus]|uniref:M2 family metallopeptidase n=1 Tax=Fretibacter rubidus TaxID=570162 RepID=UPI00352B51F5
MKRFMKNSASNLAVMMGLATAAALTLSACNQDQLITAPEANAPVEASAPTQAPAAAPAKSSAPTVQEAREFLQDAEKQIVELREYAARVYWVNANFINYDTNWLAAKAGAEGAKLSTTLANKAKRFNGLALPGDMQRKMDGLKRGSNFPAPETEGAAVKLSTLMTKLDSTYGTGEFAVDVKDKRIIKILDTDGDGTLTTEVPKGKIHLGQASDIIAKSRDPEVLQTVWEGWRTVSKPMKSDYAKMVTIVNEGASELGFADTGALWRSGYDMPADDFVKESDRLFEQIKPLYEHLHCNARAALNKEYGDSVVPLDQPIRADLLGNMWAQSWGNIYDLVEPEGAAEGVDLTALLLENDYDQMKMVKTGEAFFSSLGFEPLPETFWERSLITKPQDREVQCHASAWDLDDRDDIRIKMCTKINGEDFSTVHHELGHNYYQRAYKDQPVFYKDGANDGFHEAIGDMIALSITPDYLVQIGLLDPKDVPGADADLSLLLRQAMDKVAFMPFGLMVDQWRWQVFSGELTPATYNEGWWALRDKYQGVRAPGDRPTDAFDPGAKYHIPGNTPYMRYFLAHVLQFQFHKAACDMAGFEGPLHRCSIYGNEEVGANFKAMMEMGASKPWPDALEAFTGQRDMDATPILEYFGPLLTYLEEENKDRTCGW